MSQKKQTEMPSQEQSLFKDTLNLPRTDFPLRADAKVNDPIMLERWFNEQLHQKAMECHQGAQKFVLHDGPPYANGNIHLGHAYNKILKDIMIKAQRMMGFHAPFVPGWDCHGLPIEHKVSQENPGLAGPELKKACREYALRWVNTQREEFLKLGILMDWQNPYITMDPVYEGATLKAFAGLVEQGCIERKNKTIPWCPNCKTALASAEIEYVNRKDPSLYVLFKLDDKTQQKIFSQVKAPVSFVVWTTTPWTLPLNRAVLIRGGAEYQLIRLKEQYIVIAAPLAEKLAALVQGEEEVIATVAAEQFEGGHVQHPFIADLVVPLILDNSVGLDEGTAAVHCAPGCGPIDYEVGVKNKLEIYSPVAPNGTYTHAIVPRELAGMPISEGQIWVIKALASAGTLFFKASINHSYPHCWRCQGGLIFRATPQWFCNLEHSGIKERALQAIDDIKFCPEQGKNFLRATVENRWEWCLSRQRVWGVPIVALINTVDNATYTSPELIRWVAQRVADEGVEYWDRVTLDELKDQGALPQDFAIENYRKETDILDVWFDSGVSHYAVLMQRPELHFPADMYLEGIDQHRGWFQSSLLTSIVLNGKAPMKAIMTHGFTVDAKGHKMSKSLGNVVAPQEIINRLGTDGLRLWVASIGNDGDAVVSDVLLANVEQVLRKIRNTCRFLLQNLYDYNHQVDAIALTELRALDKAALYTLVELQENVINWYKKGDLTAIFHALSEYCAVTISALYGDVTKDCLYCEKANGHKRRSAQTVFYLMLDALTRLVAPIMSFTAESVSDFYQNEKRESIHLQTFANMTAIKKALAGIDAKEFEKQWRWLHDMRSALLKLLEAQREQGIIRHSLEAQLTVYYPYWQDITLMGEHKEQFLRDFLIVSHIALAQSSDGLESTSCKGLFGKADHAAGQKCPRCWQWDTVVDEKGLCRRCHGIV